MEEKDIKLQRFGRYLILDHLVDGGMAKICRARYLGEQADKIVAIKMIQSQYSLDPSFKKMFMDEIKVAFGLIHPNIAQTYDYGILDGRLYTAMEYVDGKNLKQFLDRLKDRKYVFPVEISTFITSQVCQGLTYAHHFNDKLTGKILNIIHRDISPHNIMITYDGAVKVIDFGIAKAETNSEETKAGTIKGKLSYLAPEYLEGMELDHRYDQFAVGITLWELLCSRKLFNASNELAILKKIQECKVPIPSTINPNVPKELDQIVMKSLSKDRNLRFQNMDQFNRALVKFLYSNYPDFNATDLNYFAKELFKDDIKEDKEKLYKYGKIDITAYLQDLKNEMERNTSPSDSAPAKTEKSEDSTAPVREKAILLDLGEEVSDKSKISKSNLSLETENSVNKAGKSGQTKMLKSNPLNQKPSLTRSSSSTTALKATNTSSLTVERSDYENSKKSSSAYKVKKVVEEDHSKKPKLFLIVAPLCLLAVAYFNKSTIMELIRPLNKEDSAATLQKRHPSSVNSLAKDQKPEIDKANYRRVVITNTNLFQVFYINDKEVKYDTQGIELPKFEKIKLRVEQENKLPIFKNFEVTEDEPSSIKLPDPSPGIFGILKSSPNYIENSTLTILINENEVVYPLPLSEVKLPVGKYAGVVKNSVTGLTKDVSFEMVENTITKLPK